MLTVIFSQQRFPHPFLSSCIAVGKLTIDLIVITCDQDVFLLSVLLWSSLFFLFCGFILAGIGGDIFSFHLSLCFLSVVTSHEFKKETNCYFFTFSLLFILNLLRLNLILSFVSPYFLIFYFHASMKLWVISLDLSSSLLPFFFLNSISNLLFNPLVIFSFNIFPF